MRKLPDSPFSGMFTSPYGLWVSPCRMRSGALWWRPLAAATRRSLGLL